MTNYLEGSLSEIAEPGPSHPPRACAPWMVVGLLFILTGLQRLASAVPHTTSLSLLRSLAAPGRSHVPP